MGSLALHHPEIYLIALEGELGRRWSFFKKINLTPAPFSASPWMNNHRKTHHQDVPSILLSPTFTRVKQDPSTARGH